MSDGRGRPETLAPDNGSRRRPEQLLTPDARTAAEARSLRTETVDYADAIFKAASTTVTKTLFTLAANQKLGVRSTRPQVAFAGADITDVDAEVGTATSGNEGAYLAGCSLIQLVAHDTRSDAISCHDLAIADASLDVVATFTATGANFGSGSATALTAGKVWFNFEIITVPDGA